MQEKRGVGILLYRSSRKAEVLSLVTLGVALSILILSSLALLGCASKPGPWHLYGEYGIHYAQCQEAADDLPSSREVIMALVDAKVDPGIGELENHLRWSLPEIEDGRDDDGNGYVDDRLGWNFSENSPETLCSQGFEPGSSHSVAISSLLFLSGRPDAVGLLCGMDVKILPLVVYDEEDGRVTTTDGAIAEAIDYADAAGCDVCLIPYNFSEETPLARQAMEESNMLFVLSAGNQGSRGLNISKVRTYPASYGLPNCIVVGNSNKRGRLSKRSNYGTSLVDLAAPGTDLAAFVSAEDLGEVSGTSYSAALVAGTAAALMSKSEGMSAFECKNLIISSALSAPALSGKTKGGGLLLDAGKAMEMLKEGM